MGIWDDTDKRAKESAGSGIFVKLEDDGDKIVGAFLGDPFPQELFWNQGKNKYEPYTEAHAKAKEKMTLRVSLNVLVTLENGEAQKTPAVKILEMNATTFRSVNKCRKRYGFDRTYFEIERNGKKKDPNTTYTVLPDDPIDAEELKKLKELKLHDLEAKSRGGSETSDPQPADDYDSKQTAGDDPISKPDAQALVDVLRTVPRENLDEFLAKFGVSKVKELKQRDLKEAQSFLGIGKKEEESGAEGESDPFED